MKKEKNQTKFIYLIETNFRNETVMEKVKKIKIDT